MASMLTSLSQQLYILKEFVAWETTTLRAKHNGRGGFTFNNISSNQSSPEQLFAVDSRQGVQSPQRTIRNAADEAILVLWRKGNESYLSRPNNTASPLAVIAPRYTRVKEKEDVYVKHAAGTADEKEIKLEVRGQDIWKRNTCVYLGDELVMQVRFVNYVTSFMPFTSNEWDVAVAEGFDMSLVCAIVVYLGTTLYDNTRFCSDYGLSPESGEGHDTKHIFRRPAFGPGSGAGAAV